MLFCAFAAEAYVNRFLVARLDEADFVAVDKLTPVDKYVIAVPRADPGVTFDRARAPMGDLKRLFKARNALVHHKPEGPPKDELTPTLLATFLIAVAEAAETLNAAEGRSNDVRPILVTKDADRLREWARECERRPPQTPSEDNHPADFMADAFARHYGEQLDEHGRRHLPPPDDPPPVP